MSEELPDINQGIVKPDLFDKFKLQLKKDFESCGLAAEFSMQLQPIYEQILDLLCSEIKFISKNSGGKLNELLYRIDISEMQIKKLTQQKPNELLEKIIAELIIKRELQKIVYKEFFKKNE